MYLDGTPALILTFSPGEKEQVLSVSSFAISVQQVHSHEISKRRQTILLLLGEKAGMREVVKPATYTSARQVRAF